MRGLVCTGMKLSWIYLILILVVKVSSRGDECPPWFTLDYTNDSLFPQCVCSQAMSSHITCNQRERTSYIKLSHCAFLDEVTNETVVTTCPYVFPQHLIHNGHIRLPQKLTQLNTFMCGHLTRQLGSPLCGRCTNGTGSSIYSFGSQCTSCSILNILYYLLLQYAPATVIFLVIIVLRITLVSPPIAHYIIYCNVMHMCLKLIAGFYFLYTSANAHVFRVLFTLNSLWTFDPLYFFSPPLCISQHIHEVYIPFLETMAALYPFTLLLLTYILIELYARDCKLIVIMWKVIYCKCGCLFGSWNSDKSLIQVFATLFLLSFMKFMGVVNSTFLVSDVFNMKNELVTTVPFIDPTVTPFSSTYLSLIILSAVILVFFILPPVLVLLLFPTTCFMKVSTYLKPRWVLALKIFTDTFYGSYKDGTNGTRDFRPAAGILFLIWIILAVTYEILHLMPNNVPFPEKVLILSLATTLIIGFVAFQPYKHRAANTSGIILLFVSVITAGLFVILDTYKFSTEMVLLCIAVATLPHCVFYGYGIYRLAKWLKQCTTTVHGEEGILCRLLRSRNDQLLMNPAGCHSRM